MVCIEWIHKKSWPYFYTSGQAIHKVRTSWTAQDCIGGPWYLTFLRFPSLSLLTETIRNVCYKVIILRQPISSIYMINKKLLISEVVRKFNLHFLSYRKISCFCYIFLALHEVLHFFFDDTKFWLLIPLHPRIIQVIVGHPLIYHFYHFHYDFLNEIYNNMRIWID